MVLTPPRALVSWSTGKDSAWALREVLRSGAVEPVALLTTVTVTFDRVSIHGVRADLLHRQAAAAGLPLRTIALPHPCSNEVYEQAFLTELSRAKAEGITHVVFGDLFLEDVREYRERLLARAGLIGSFPLWGRDTRELAAEMIDGGLSAVVVCVDSARLFDRFAGRDFDEAFLGELPAEVDPCGERGEFHTFARAGPMFRGEIPVKRGEAVRRDGLVYMDLMESAKKPLSCGRPRSSSSRRCSRRRP